jgi:preprotein translocase subunit SecG
VQQIFLGLAQYLINIKPTVNLLIGAAGALAVVFAIATVAIVALWRAKQRYQSEDADKRQIARGAARSGSVMIWIGAIPMFGFAMLAIGLSILYRIAIATIGAIGSTVPGATLPPGFP